jgi:hypothetical protein
VVPGHVGCAKIRLEQAAKVILRDADAMVGNRHGDTLLIDLGRDLDRRFGRRVFCRV